MEARAWKRGELLVAGGGAAAVAASAETAGSVYGRFAADFTGLSAADRAGLALWDFRPLGAAIFALGAVAILAGLAERPARAENVERVLKPTLAMLSGAFAALGLIIVALAVWIGARGFAGDAGGLAVRFTGGERAMTIATQALGWIPLVVLFVLLALRLTGRPQRAAAPPEPASVLAEMDDLWRERLAFSPRRERGRALLARIRALEEQGNLAEAQELAKEMRRL